MKVRHGFMLKRSLTLCLLVASPALAQSDQTPRVYAAGSAVPVEFSLQERSRQGGRTTPFFRDYRPDIAFDGGARVTCVVSVPGGGGVEPGTTRQIDLTCPTVVQEGQRFEAFERRRPIGTGVVLRRD